MDPIFTGFVGTLVGAAVALIAGVAMPVLLRRYDRRRDRVAEIKQLVPQILEVCAANLTLRNSGKAIDGTATPGEVWLVTKLDMIAGREEYDLLRVLKMATVATRTLDADEAQAHLVAAMSVIGEWAQTGTSRGMYAAYEFLVAHGSERRDLDP